MAKKIITTDHQVQITKFVLEYHKYMYVWTVNLSIATVIDANTLLASNKPLPHV